MIRDLVPQIGHGAHNPVISPTRILLGQSHDQALLFLVHGRAAQGLTKSRSAKLLGEELSIPAEQGIPLAAAATSARALRPGRWTIPACVTFSDSESSNLPLIFAQARFSAARYSFLSSNSSSTVPLMYANMRAQIIYRPSVFLWNWDCTCSWRFEEKWIVWKIKSSSTASPAIDFRRCG